MIVNPKDYVEESHMELLALCEQTDLGRAILEACRRRAADTVAKMRRNPKIGAEVIREDIRYQLGQADEVEFVPELVKECQRQLTKGS